MSKWSKENIVKVVVGLTVVAAAGWAGVLWTEAWSVGTYGAYVIALGLLGGIGPHGDSGREGRRRLGWRWQRWSLSGDC